MAARYELEDSISQPPVRSEASDYVACVADELGTQNSQHLICAECGIESDDRAWSWEALLGVEDDDSVCVVCLCPECAEELLL